MYFRNLLDTFPQVFLKDNKNDIINTGCERMENFYFELPTIERKQEALEYLKKHVIHGTELNGTGGLNDCLKGMTYEEWLDDVVKCQEKEYAESKNLVPGITFFTIRESDNKIVGMLN